MRNFRNNRRRFRSNSFDRNFKVGSNDQNLNALGNVSDLKRKNFSRNNFNSPKLILADEPTSSLDDENCDRVIKLLKKQASEFKAQLIVITHDNRLKKHFKKSIKL